MCPVKRDWIITVSHAAPTPRLVPREGRAGHTKTSDRQHTRDESHGAGALLAGDCRFDRWQIGSESAQLHRSSSTDSQTYDSVLSPNSTDSNRRISLPAAVPQGIFPFLGRFRKSPLREVAGTWMRHTVSPPHFLKIGGIMSRAYQP